MEEQTINGINFHFKYLLECAICNPTNPEGSTQLTLREQTAGVPSALDQISGSYPVNVTLVAMAQSACDQCSTSQAPPERLKRSKLFINAFEIQVLPGLYCSELISFVTRDVEPFLNFVSTDVYEGSNTTFLPPLSKYLQQFDQEYCPVQEVEMVDLKSRPVDVGQVFAGPSF